ncbi:MAG: DUF3168 domain-containing protein [Firmicutes bacterium]|nr:DUF3168 domain-containing protein [Bacillota bacterium]
MDAIGQILFSVLSNTSSVIAYVGNRIYPGYIPQGTNLPAVTYNQIAGIRSYTHSGPAGLVDGHWQITVWAESYAVMDALTGHIRDAFNGYFGVVNDRHISIIFIENETDVSAIEAEEIAKYGKAIDIQILYQE